MKKELSTYLDSIGVLHVLDAPYHPQIKVAIEDLIKQYNERFQKLMKKKNLIWVKITLIPSQLNLK